MGGGDQSSLGYLFGSGKAPKPAEAAAPRKQVPVSTSNGPHQKSTACAPAVDVVTKEKRAFREARQTNNYFRADAQNTDRPSTKVHATMSGGSSLFGGGGS